MDEKKSSETASEAIDTLNLFRIENQDLRSNRQITDNEYHMTDWHIKCVINKLKQRWLL